MKRILLTSLVLIFILSVIPLNAFAADVEIVSGKDVILICEEADSVTIGGIEFSAAQQLSFKAFITVSDCTSEYSYIYLNGNKLKKLVDGLNEIEIDSGELNQENNELKIMLGAGNATYDENIIYGSVNADDIAVESVSFSGTVFDSPKAVNYYLPISGQSGFNVIEKEYSGKISVGDGWSADTGLGGSTPNTPVSVGFLFDKPDENGVFIIDSTQIPDGKQTVTFSKDGKTVSEKEIIIDNKKPVISFSVKNGATLSCFDKFEYSVDDITTSDINLYLDGKAVDTVDLKTLSSGNHSVMVTATDKAGNASTESVVFNITDRKYNVVFNEKSVTMSVYGEADVYTGALLTDIRMYENRLGTVDQNYLRSDNEVLVSFDDKAELTTSAIGNTVPYHSFVVNTSGVKEDSVIVSYTGETGNGSDIVLKAWNYKNEEWDEIATVENGESVSVKVSLEEYSYKDKIRVNAIPKLVYNGSESIIWNSDTQYYSRFDDLNAFYYKINEFAVEQYNDGKIGYYVHTGDLVDQTNAGDETAHSEYTVASNAQKILDDALVPNGVVSGNHDVVHETADYSYYWKYFGENRYENFDWYGGNLNNNMHHYDLVSIGAYDFVFLYLGCYNETEADTIAWANAVCEAYPDRNVIICTHEYILPSGAYSSERSEIIWDEIIVPNENVIMILCGHNPGVCDQMHQVGDSDRYVLEILADYQFAELGVGPEHVLNNCTCDGEGYIRLMSFNEAGQVISTTYSVTAADYDVDPYNYYPSYLDSFVYDIDFIPADRSIKTLDFNVIYNTECVGQIGDNDISLAGEDAFFAEIKGAAESVYSKVYVLNEYKTDYSADKPREYETVTKEKVGFNGLVNVSENFRMNEENTVPDEDYITVGLDLLPDDATLLYKTSGGTIIDKVINENGGVSITHESASGNNWLTLAANINKQIDVSEYDRLYFGVTANKNAKWNIYVNFQGKELNFSQNKDIASLFGYVNSLPSDITGTWNGYIELDSFISGKQTLNSIYLVTATPEETVTFDYLFLAKSDGSKIRFITDENTSIAFDGAEGTELSLPGDPYKQGYKFDGWYTSADGGEKIQNNVTFGEDVIEIYARFSEYETETADIKTYNTEINMERPAVGKIIFVCASFLIMVGVVIALLFKIKKSGKKNGEKK